MTFPFSVVFLGLLLAYMVYSVWAGLDARYPIAAALVLLVVTAVVDAVGQTGPANTLAEFVFFLLGGGVVLLLVDHVRERRPTPSVRPAHLRGRPKPETAKAAKQPEPSAEQSFDGFEEEPVALVDAAGHEYE